METSRFVVVAAFFIGAFKPNDSLPRQCNERLNDSPDIHDVVIKHPLDVSLRLPAEAPVWAYKETMDV
ncbi:hypothetical protein DK37_15295 [Halomonas sp. SUBG004]|nr:hypothetical protein DK37_15295 [Halomonas sp. SUBG004]